MQIAEEDAKALGIEEGDMVEVTSRRGSMRAAARIGDIEPGLVFVPFHYGDFDEPGRDGGRERADAHRMGRGEQAAAFQVRRRQGGEGHPGDRAADLAEAVSEGVGSAATAIRSVIRSEATAGRSHVANYLGDRGEERRPPGRGASRRSPNTTGTSPT